MTTVQALWNRVRSRVLHPARVRRMKKDLRECPFPQAIAIAAALEKISSRRSDSERFWIRKIEVERNRLLSSDEPLVDGTLGEGGLYDSGSTIREACRASKSAEACAFLMTLTRELDPSVVLELGTNVGMSSAYLAAALQINGRANAITTLDASAYRQRLAREVHRNTGLKERVRYVEGLFTDTLKPTLSGLGVVDLAFIDGHHQYQPTLDYMEMILEHASDDAALVFDDIRWSDGMRAAWDRIRFDDRFGLVVDLQSMSVCFRGKSQGARAVFGPIPFF